MNFSKQSHSIEEARQVEIIDYLSKLGHHPVKIRNQDYWYLSPLRNEKTASFKVNKRLNRWYDHGLGKGGNIIDFAILYHDCTVAELLQKLNNTLLFHQPALQQSPAHFKDCSESKLKVTKEELISSFALVRYLQQRRIPIEVANRFCNQISYELNSKVFYGIGLKSNSGGYEIRNPYFKGSSSPKDITTFNNGSNEVAVFEGFIDFLSFMVIHQNQEQKTFDYVILNSVSFFEKARPFMEEHKSIRLYLDRDTAGQNCSRYALSLSGKYRDESHLYKVHKDLNDWLMNIGKAEKKKLGYRQ